MLSLLNKYNINSKRRILCEIVFLKKETCLQQITIRFIRHILFWFYKRTVS